MKKSIFLLLSISIIVVCSATILIGYDLILESGPATTTVTYYQVYYAGNTGAPQQQLPDTVIQFTAVFEINHGFFNLFEKQTELNFDDFYLTSNGQVLTPLPGYSENQSHGSFTIKSGNMYAWNARYVVEKGISNCKLHYNGTANVNIVYVDSECPYSGLPVAGQN